jgi:hypothetical protein
MATDKPRDRRVIGKQIAGDHPIGDILAAVPLDRPRRAHPGRERVQDQRHHHRRLIRRATVTIASISGIKRRQIQLADRVDHKPRKVIGRQPLPHIPRQQKPLPTTALGSSAPSRNRLERRGRTPFARQRPGPPAAASEEGKSPAIFRSVTVTGLAPSPLGDENLVAAGLTPARLGAASP